MNYPTEHAAARTSSAQIAVNAFGVKRDPQYGYVLEKWRENWDELVAFVDFAKEMRRMLYTTNPVEALHRIIHKVVKGKAAEV